MTDADLTWRPVDFEFRVNPEPDDEAWNAALELVSQWAERHGLSLIGFASQAANDDGETFRTVRDQRDALSAELAEAKAQARDAHERLVMECMAMDWATDGRLSTGVGHAVEYIRRLTAERDAARAEVAALEGRIRGLADGVDPDWRREHEGLVTPADLRALLTNPKEK